MALYLVDGYNVLLRGRRSAIEERGLEAARTELENDLQRFARGRERGTEVVVVYDGRRGLAGSGRRSASLRVLFARPPQTADDVILDHCRRLDGGKQVIVVTSDFSDIGSRLHGLPCRWISADEFLRSLERPPHAAAGRHAEKPERLSAEQVDDWLRDFGMHPDEDLP